MSEEPSREEQIVAAVLQFATREERLACLERACAGDAALRQRVEAMLQAREQGGATPDPEMTIKSAPAPVSPSVEPLTEKPGDRIGRYKILQKIGDGGCGVVYMAEQDQPVRRRVALKVIKLGMDTRQVIARFEAERQALALMDHPNIAKVLDAGATDKGRPFFVMELVKGIRITDYCDQNNLSTRDRLELFIQVCHAIQHAHQKGIIHRDIKPSNILVTLHDGVPVPKVIDFGIAKATSGQHLTEKTLFTAYEQFVGTPVYMSPEQAEMSGLDIDTRSDIYALGVLLYELLTGKTPFDAKRLHQAALDEVRRIIREEEPVPPSTRLSTLEAAEQTTVAKLRQSEPPKLFGLIRGDLDWIVMKCLEKDRTRRYETANGLSMDIQRYLDNEPIVARPPSKLYRFQKMARRNKLVFTAATAVAAALLLGIIGSTWQAVRAREQRERAEQEARRAEEATGKEQQERARAEAEAQKARSEADNLQRLLNYTSAGYMLSQGRLDEAYADIEKAIQSGANWEYGHLLGRIVSSSRDDWQLVMRAAIADRPSVGCFVGDETPYLVLAGDGGAKLFSVADGRLVSAGGPTDAIHLTGISGSRCAVATRGRKIIVYQLPDWRQLGTYESVDPIVYVKADAGGRWLGMLDAQATVTVLDLNDMHEAARRSFKPVVGETAGGQTSAAVSISPQAAIGFSPSGKQLLLNAGMPGKPTVVWDWPTDSTKVLSIVTEAAQIYAENRVVAYFALTLPSDFIRLSFHDLDRDATQAQSPRTVVLRELLAGGNQIFTAWGGPSAQGDIPDLRAALIIPDAINEIALRGDFTATSVARFGSLWPQAHDDLRFMAFDIPRQLLALSGSSGVLVFQFRERFPALSSTVPGRQLDPQWTNHPLASRDYATRYWSLGQTRDELIVCGASSRAAEERYSDVLRVSRINYETQADSPVYGEGPKPAEDRVMIPWGIASIPNGKILGILWQESSAAGGGGNIDSQYFRKAIAVYDLQQENSAENPLLPQRLIWLDDYAGIEGRSNRNFGLSPQGRTAIFCTTSGQTTGYRLQDGQKVYEFNAGRSYAVSPDASLFAGGDYAEPHPVQVWDVDTGKLVMSTSKTGLVRRMAFSADNQLLYVGWRSDLMDVFSVKDGSLVKEVKSSVAPVAVSPVGDRYVGILQDKNQPTSGSMVLASLGDGQTVLVLNPSAHILNNANFSSDGKSVAFIRNRTSVTLLTSFTSQEAERLLTHVEPMAVLNGQGTVTWPDGMKYVGEFRDGKMDGQGTLTWPQGRRYVGGFKDDKCDGQGVETRPNGTNLQEEWKDGQWYRVSGTLVYLDGTREVGTWNYDGTKSGGTITWKDGREYKGDWIVSDLGTEQPHGMGTMTWPDGRAYVGQFRYGKMEGKGRMTYSNGKVEDGVWRENQLAEATR